MLHEVLQDPECEVADDLGRLCVEARDSPGCDHTGCPTIEFTRCFCYYFIIY